MDNTKITVRNNGPLRIEGSFTIEDSEGNTFDLAGRTVIGLCRCGKSENKPFCDGAHKKEGKLKSIKYLAEESKDVYFCGCKMTKNPPFCDGSHSKP